jgi:hypothetical protein
MSWDNAGAGLGWKEAGSSTALDVKPATNGNDGGGDNDVAGYVGGGNGGACYNCGEEGYVQVWYSSTEQN